MINPDAVKWCLVFLGLGLVMILVNLPKPNKSRYWDKWEYKEAKSSRTGGIVVGVLVAAFCAYALLAIGTIKFQAWRERRAAPPPSVAPAEAPEPPDPTAAQTAEPEDEPVKPAAPIARPTPAARAEPAPAPAPVATPATTPVEGWAHGPVKLGNGELFMSGVVQPDGAVLALTSAGMVEHRGSWLFRLDARGRAEPSFGQGGGLALVGFAPGAREVAYDEAHQRIWVASIEQADVEERVSIFRLSASGAQEGVTKLAVPRLGAPRGGSSSGNVALWLDDQGRLVVIARADSPWTGSAQLAAYRIGEQGLDASFGGLLAKIPARSAWQRDLSLVRGPRGELYVSAGGGARTWLMRLDESGHLDRYFGSAGLVALDQPGYALAAATPAGIVVGGIVTQGGFTIRRVGYDGTIDPGYARKLRRKPMKLREGEITHLDGLVYTAGSLWAALDSFERIGGSGTTAIARYADDGEEIGRPVFLDEVLPHQARVAAQGLFRFGSRGLLLAVQASPAHAARAGIPPDRSDIYLRPLATAAFSDFGYIAQYQPPLPDAPAPSAVPITPTSSPAAPADAKAEEQSPGFYSYSDHGVVHVVSGLDKVPAALRPTAHPMP